MILKKVITVISTAALLAFSCAPAVSAADADQPEMRDISTMELVEDMGIGINLGNTFESCGDWIAQWGDGSVESYETAWGSPVITQQMIQGYAREGFGVLRVPVAWSNLMGDNYTISSAYLARVRQIVDWALEADMYVILNIHYDGGWFSGFSTNKTECMTKYTRIWTQLTEEFKDYDDYLMFESLNEEGVWNDIALSDAYALLNEINQTFVNIVRSSGGNNDERHLLIAGYATDIVKTCDNRFVMPNDPQNRCAVSVHYYTPAAFAILEEDASWSKNRETWGTQADINELNKYMNLMKTNFIDEGIPVIIGEYGCPTKNKNINSVRYFISSVCEAAVTRDMCPVLWDITDLHYSRTDCKLINSDLKKALAKFSNAKYDLGDINKDGTVNALDASDVLTAYAASATGQDTGFSANQTIAADADSNGAVNALDASIILTYYAYTATGGKLSFSEYIAK
ncbi:MAG: cellulase family glycosylhydrolase [Ruminococcus sp.]|nr:cellulase family glycosylhydrolase [Ruminococcus sp.]